MKVSKAIETELGTVMFEGELDATELDYVLSIGLNVLLMKGALPNVTIMEDTPLQ